MNKNPLSTTNSNIENNSKINNNMFDNNEKRKEEGSKDKDMRPKSSIIKEEKDEDDIYIPNTSKVRN